MKRFDVKSFAAGIIIGTLGITTAFASTNIRSAVLSDTKLTLRGIPISFSKPLISVTMEDSQASSLYVPADEAFEKLGYKIAWDSGTNTLDLVPESGYSQEVTGGGVQGNVVMDLANHANQKNIAESGSFQAMANQILTITVTSTIKGGTVELFLFDPYGKERRITIGASHMTEEIPLEPGTWQYNCSGIFTEGGDVRITGTIKQGA